MAILKAGGCSAVFLFGSTARGTMHAGSDLDLAVRGCPPQHFFHLLGHLLTDLDHPVDLLDLDVPSPFVAFLLTQGNMVQLDETIGTTQHRFSLDGVLSRLKPGRSAIQANGF